ncbi:MAG: PTS sugar transporter subunit IIA [Candidatus Krumholzibacteriia bacterium]
MRLVDYTSVHSFLPRQDSPDLTDAVKRLVDSFAAAGAVREPARLLEEIMRREQEGSTALASGLAIPHARADLVDTLHLGVATLAHPVEPGNETPAPIDVVILIVGPRGDPRHMLRILARLARVVKHGALLPRLRDSSTPEAMREALLDAEAARA